MPSVVCRPLEYHDIGQERHKTKSAGEFARLAAHTPSEMHEGIGTVDHSNHGIEY
jgi:hypothetical protein